MGTNYYVQGEYCAECGHYVEYPGEGVHIGKSSYGWTFALHSIPEMGLTAWDKGWWPYLQNKLIVDECGKHISLADFKHIVFHRASGDGRLQRSVEARYEGFIDLVEGEFS